MESGPKCWVCLRSSDEINSALGGGTGEKWAQTKSKLIRVEQLKSQFIESSGLWASSIPAELMKMDMRFVLDNRERFASLRVLNEMAEARYLVRRLAEASHAVSTGKSVSFGGISLPPSRKGERELLLSRYSAFEERGRRSKEAGENHDEDSGRARWLDGLSFAEGLEYLREGVVLHFQTQKELLESELSSSLHSPSFQVGFVRLDGLPNVPLCTVCQGLISKRLAMGNAPSVYHRHHSLLSGVRSAFSARPENNDLTRAN